MTVWGLLWFPINSRIQFLFKKTLFSIEMIEIAVTLLKAFVKMIIFTILLLSVHEHVQIWKRILGGEQGP